MKWEAYIELQWKYNAPCNYRILLISDKMIMQIEMLKTLKQFVSNLLLIVKTTFNLFYRSTHDKCCFTLKH